MIHVLGMQGKCIHCGTSVPADSLVPNFALRAAVHAFKQEDHVCEFTSMKVAKRKREQPEQQTEGSDGKTLALDLHVAGEQASSLDGSRPRGVQFPFAVGDQVLIKGNKRTPERFVGKEAIITTQCLNGWYLVQTLDQGESVRLQYRSLQKLGEKDPQPDLEAGISPDHVGSGEKPRKSCYPKEAVPSLLPTTEGHPEGCAKEASPTMTVVFPIMPVKGTRTELHKKARKGDLTRSIDTAAASSMPGVGASGTSSPDMQSDVKMANLSKVREETEVVEVVEDDPYDMKPVWTAPPLSEKAEALIDKTNGGSNVDKLLDLPQVWEGLKEPQGLQKPKEGSEVGSSPIIVPNIEVGDTFTIRSKRSVLANRGPSMSLSMESDPYRKVYSSGSRRRGSVGEAVVQEQLAPISVARKPLTKCPTQVGEKAGLKWVGPTGEKQIHETVSIPNMNDILAIMQKDILGLEKQIPWNCLVKSWKMRRANWRKAVKESCTVLELGTIVKTFRSGLLLTGAGGISDEEWEKRMGFAMESGDVELLVSLWGRLYDDVFKWVQSKSKQTRENVIDTNLVETFAELRKQFPQLQVAGLSPARITTAATLAAADAIAEHHINANALLAVPMKLLQQHSREDLFALREALEREKRHLAAKLAQLEENETLNREKEDLVAGFLATAPPSSSLDMSAPPTLDAMLPMPRNFVGGEQGIQGVQGDEMDEGESDAVDSTHDADGEATDMSDSD
ncbi:hypothetical protein BDL97_05G049000 [Sphagnum fallax]|nr:hypothetical protein BDL97_05G049000 [Sphagnum fallax]